MAGEKIMLVDDDQDFVEVLSMTLEGEGYEVVTAYSGEEARESIPEEMPHLIVLDVMMETETEGFKVARWLRERGRE